MKSLSHLTAVCVVTCIAIVCFSVSGRAPSLSRAAPPSPSGRTHESGDAPPDLATLLATSKSAALQRNDTALALCTFEINGILDREFTDLYFAAESAAKDVATYGNCVSLIATLASDQVFGSSDAEAWVRARIDERLAPKLERCQKDIQTAVDRLDRELAASTLRMATELAALGTTGSSAAVPEYARVLDAVSLEVALGDLGIHGAIVTPCVAIDVYALIHTRVVQWLIKKTLTLAGWIFARPIATAVVSVGAAAVDGPLPIGDCFAVVGAAWTAWDISCLRSDFENQLVSGIRDVLPEARRAIQQDIVESLRERMVSHAEAQQRIHDQTAETLLP